MIKKILFLSLVVSAFCCVSSCSKDDDDPGKTATCTDGIKNGNETGVDCGGSCAPCSTSYSYYINYKKDAESVAHGTNNPGYQNCGCACFNTNPIGVVGSFIEICENDWVDAADIQSWEGDTLYFKQGYPEVEFGYAESDTETYSTDNASNQSGSWLYISDLVADGSYGTLQIFKATGTLQCKVADYNGGPDIAITNGTFVIRLAE